jgi:hypothetical protein
LEEGGIRRKDERRKEGREEVKNEKEEERDWVKEVTKKIVERGKERKGEKYSAVQFSTVHRCNTVRSSRSEVGYGTVQYSTVAVNDNKSVNLPTCEPDVDPM